MKHPLLLFCLLGTQAQAQIIYTDVTPDLMFDMDGDTCRLDLNNDGTTDFYIRYHMQAGSGCMGCNGSPNLHPSWVRLDALGTNAVDTVVDLDAPYDGAAELLPLTVIDASLHWIGSNDRVLANVSTYCSTICVPHNGDHGPWNGTSVDSSRFLGLRFESGGNTYYGWARLSITRGVTLTVTSFTLKDYAYNSVPDEMILAGEGADISTSVASIARTSLQVSPNPFTSALSVAFEVQPKGAVICNVRALTGQLLFTRTMTGSSARSPVIMDLASLAPGIYLLDVVADGGHIVRKVMKE
ncbi:MAG TPA: T9SS type A sorting domain-containing protein [Flavobacteriales bacterium]|nr:T9SS type A sorting domain-containing protein [Flavobacteriales bacterium]